MAVRGFRAESELFLSASCEVGTATSTTRSADIHALEKTRTGRKTLPEVHSHGCLRGFALGRIGTQDMSKQFVWVQENISCGGKVLAVAEINIKYGLLRAEQRLAPELCSFDGTTRCFQ